MSKGIIYEYEDGGRYCGEWENDSSQGYGCGTGPGGHGEYEGMWEHGGQVSGTYTWPNGMKYAGTWKENQRDGFGKEVRIDGTEYCGEFVRGSRGPYGVTRLPNGVYRGSWRNGKQDGEGEEVYLDGGCYRGQYKNGVRFGYGTRTSSAYERRGSEPAKTHDNVTPSKKTLSTLIAPLTNLNNKKLSFSISPDPPNSVDDLSSLDHTQMTSEECKHASTVAQIYEGEWKDDKRHGYGVIKCINSYTYYGHWINNTRTGYGVMVYENGIKEEGQWQNGQLIYALKRKKLHLKTHQLETKVQLAHTQAIQAADSARNKALLSKSRAGSAMDKAKVAHGVAGRAEKNAQLAREKAEQYKNAPKISEGLKSPISDISISLSPTPPPSRQSLHTSESRTSDSPQTSRHLDVTSSFPHAPSFENIHSLIPCDTGSEDRSDDDADSYLNSTTRKRIQYQRNRGSKGSQASVEDDWDSGGRLKHRSSHVVESYNPNLEMTAAAQRRTSEGANNASQRYNRHNFSPNVTGLEEEEEEEEMERYEGSRNASLRRRKEGEEFIDGGQRRKRRNKTTGEIEHGGSEDELAETVSQQLGGKPAFSKHRQLKPKNSLTMDMLVNNMNRMANWNKIMACINFVILVCLLFVILLVVISINYYQLSSYYHNSPEDQGPAPGYTPMA